MSDPTKFPQMHIAESVFNRMMNMKAELLPVNIPQLPQQQQSGPSPQQVQQIGDLMNTPQDTATAAVPSAGDTAIQGATIDAGLGTGAADAGAAGAGAAGAGAAGAGAAGVGAGDLAAAGAGAAGLGATLGAGAAGGAALGAGAAVAGEAVATGAELLPLLALA